MINQLQNIKEQLFDAPKEVKESFNNIVQYFDRTFYEIGIVEKDVYNKAKEARKKEQGSEKGYVFNEIVKSKVIVIGKIIPSYGKGKNSGEDEVYQKRRDYQNKTGKEYEFVNKEHNSRYNSFDWWEPGLGY